MEYDGARGNQLTRLPGERASAFESVPGSSLEGEEAREKNGEQLLERPLDRFAEPGERICGGI
eukprot:scaffold3350_cov268-Pinguiococcus_pyrenoidosus.AAC.2